MNKINGLFRLLRFELPFSAGVCVVMGQLLALGNFASVFISIYGFLSIFCISASILVMNYPAASSGVSKIRLIKQ